MALTTTRSAAAARVVAAVAAAAVEMKAAMRRPRAGRLATGQWSLLGDTTRRSASKPMPKTVRLKSSKKKTAIRRRRWKRPKMMP